MIAEGVLQKNEQLVSRDALVAELKLRIMGLEHERKQLGGKVVRADNREKKIVKEVDVLKLVL